MPIKERRIEALYILLEIIDLIMLDLFTAFKLGLIPVQSGSKFYGSSQLVAS